MSGNVFVELEERVKKEILVKLETQGMATEEIDLSQEYMFGLESTDGGSDSSASDGLPIHLQYMSTQSDKKKKKLRSRKERDRQRGKSEEKKATSTASTQAPAEAKLTEKGGPGHCSSVSKQTKDRYDRQAHRNEYLEALTHTYLQNGVLLGPDMAPAHLRYSGNKLPAIPYNMEGLCPHHEQAMAAQYMTQQLRHLQPPVENAIEDFISTHLSPSNPDKLSQKRHLLEIAVSRERDQFIQGLKKKGDDGANNTKLSKSPLLEALPKPSSAESDRGSLGKGRKSSATPVKSESSQSACGADTTRMDRSLSKLSGDRTSDSDPYMQCWNKPEISKKGSKSKRKQEEKSNQPKFPNSTVLGSIPKQNAPQGTPGGFVPLAQSIIGEDKGLHRTPDYKHSKSHSEDKSNRSAAKLGHPSAKLKHNNDLGIRSDFHMVYPDPNIDVGISKPYKSAKMVTSRRAYTTESQLRQIEFSRGSALEGAANLAVGRESPRGDKMGNTRGEKGSAKSEKRTNNQPASLQSPTRNRSKLTPTASQYIKRLMQEADEEISELTTELEEDVKRERRLMENLRKLDDADPTTPKPGSGLSAARLSNAISPASPLDWAVGCVQMSPVKRPQPLDTNWNSVRQSSAESCSRKTEDHCQRGKDHCQRRESFSRMKSGKQGKRELLGTVPAKISLTINDGQRDMAEQTARHFLPSSRPTLRNSSRRH